MHDKTAGNDFPEKGFGEYCRFVIPQQSRILMLGCPHPDFLKRLSPSVGVGVASASAGKCGIDDKSAPVVTYYVEDIGTFFIAQSFDYIIINSILPDISDVQRFLGRLLEMSTPGSRLIINSDDSGRGFLAKKPQPRTNAGTGSETCPNRFSRRDLEIFLAASGYEVIVRRKYVLSPGPLYSRPSIIKWLVARLPVASRSRRGCLTVARPHRPPENRQEISTSVVITCRDEEGNIEALVERIPTLGGKTEIIFVEGHSVDQTTDKIVEMMRKYPEKDIKIFHQTGKGQGDAFRLGCDKARGDFLIWLEADLTTPPEEARLIWEAYINGHGEYINGTRFIYPMAPKAMPLLNNLGNRFFSLLLSLITGRRFTDTLCGFKGITRAHYLNIVRNPSRFDAMDPFGDFQLILGAVKFNLAIAEVPVHYQPRTYGEPKSYGRSRWGLLSHARILLKICRLAFIDFRLR